MILMCAHSWYMCLSLKDVGVRMLLSELTSVSTPNTGHTCIQQVVCFFVSDCDVVSLLCCLFSFCFFALLCFMLSVLSVLMQTSSKSSSAWLTRSLCSFHYMNSWCCCTEPETSELTEKYVSYLTADVKTFIL